MVQPHIDDHITTFNDNHILLACLGAKEEKVVEEMMDSITTYLSERSVSRLTVV